MDKIKKDLRTLLLAKRNQLLPSQVAEKSKSITNLVLKYFPLSSSERVFLYLPIRKEVNTWYLIENYWKNKIEVFLPCCKEEFGLMHFYKLEDKKQLQTGKFNIPEPRTDICTPYLGTPPRIIFLPGVGFDWNRYRLGYGGGYYDRLLAKDDFKSTLKIGLAYHFQIVNKLPKDKWDRPVDVIITEKGIF